MSTVVDPANLVMDFEFANGWSENPTTRRGIGPQSEWLELGPVEWVKKYVLPRIKAGWRKFWFHCPGGVGARAFADDGAGNTIPVYEFDQLQQCRDSGDANLRRVYNELPTALAMIKEAAPDAWVCVYLGRFSALAQYVADKTRPGVIEMMKAIVEVFEYFEDAGVDCIALDNAIPSSDTWEFALMELMRAQSGDTKTTIMVEPPPRTVDDHLFPFPSCFNTDYFVDQLKRSTARAFMTTGATSVARGRLAPGSLPSQVATDAAKWSQLGFWYGVQSHLLHDLSVSPAMVATSEFV